MLRGHPLLGVGPDNFRWLFAAYSDVAVNNLGIHAHDQYLESLADSGILGFVSFAWLLIALVLAAARRIRHARADWPWRAAILASLTAWLVHAVLDDFERFWPTHVAFWLIVGLVACRPSAGRTCRSAVEQPVDRANQRDDHQQHEDAGRTAQCRAAAATSAKAHHVLIVRASPRATVSRQQTSVAVVSLPRSCARRALTNFTPQGAGRRYPAE